MVVRGKLISAMLKRRNAAFGENRVEFFAVGEYDLKPRDPTRYRPHNYFDRADIDLNKNRRLANTQSDG